MTKRDCKKYGCQVYIVHQASHYELATCITCGMWYVKRKIGTYAPFEEFEAAWGEYKYFITLGRTTFL